MQLWEMHNFILAFSMFLLVFLYSAHHTKTFDLARWGNNKVYDCAVVDVAYLHIHWDSF